jgi:hypothetical protein
VELPNPGFGDPAACVGNELCDLLVVFRNTFLLFSDKNCSYPTGPDEGLNWRRWYKRSIERSINQLLGAKKTLLHFPDRVYTDLRLQTKFPLDLAASEHPNVFLIAVVHEAVDACKRKHARPSLTIDTRLSDSSMPLTVGCQFDDNFVHILDDVSLDILFNKLDTVVDFLDYLNEKEKALKSRPFIIRGEENLLATYLAHRDRTWKHFIPLDHLTNISEPVEIEDGKWATYIASNQCRHSSEENKISYNIDVLIEHFVTTYLNGELIEGQDKDHSYHEQALRLIASENRFGRRIVSTSFVSILREPEKSTFWASTVPSPGTKGVRYVFLTYPRPPSSIDIDRCEQLILKHLSQHLLVAAGIFEDSKTLIGFAVPNPGCGMTSQFLRILDTTSWTAEDYNEASELQKETGIFDSLEVENYLHVE